jgi:23S rRNA pseudouridine1911/1915/1917 synthase
MHTPGLLRYHLFVTERIDFVVRTEENKKRLDQLLFDRFGGLSKMYLREIVKSEKCEVNGRNENVGYRVRPNDFVEIELDLARETAMRPQDIPINIVFEDEHLVVVDKPSGLLVHPTNRDKSGTLLNALAYHLNNTNSVEGSAVRPGLVHRLDKQTSGLMVIAKNVRAHRRLAKGFQYKHVVKRYTALVEGNVEADEGMIDSPVGRFAEHKHWDVKEGGKEAVTLFWVKERNDDHSVLELEPVTGRTNQLRIHCAYIGHPILGDVQRGGREFARLCLHAHRLAFSHPKTNEMMDFTAAADFLAQTI